MGSLYLCIIVTATKVEALPMGVKLPPKLEPKMTDHQSGESATVPLACKILASIADNGILSVTELMAADTANSMAVPYWLSSVPIMKVMPLPMRFSTAVVCIPSLQSLQRGT